MKLTTETLPTLIAALGGAEEFVKKLSLVAYDDDLTIGSKGWLRLHLQYPISVEEVEIDE